jgi:hypothetical protein
MLAKAFNYGGKTAILVKPAYERLREKGTKVMRESPLQ